MRCVVLAGGTRAAARVAAGPGAGAASGRITLRLARLRGMAVACVRESGFATVDVYAKVYTLLETAQARLFRWATSAPMSWTR